MCSITRSHALEVAAGSPQTASRRCDKGGNIAAGSDKKRSTLRPVACKIYFGKCIAKTSAFAKMEVMAGSQHLRQGDEIWWRNFLPSHPENLPG